MDNHVTDEEVKRLEKMIADLYRSNDENKIVMTSLNRDLSSVQNDLGDVQTALYGSQGKAGSFQRGLVSLFLDVQSTVIQNQKQISDLADLFERQQRESVLVRDTIKAESDASYEKMKRMFSIAGGVITVITLLQLLLNIRLAVP